jgi:hypothetical protein
MRAQKEAMFPFCSPALSAAMSALDISAVTALSCKAETLISQGGYAWAAEKYASAVAAAQALGVADCLVVARLQLEQAACLVGQAASPAVAPEEADGMRRKAFALLPSALKTLQRRKAARTLLPGACRAHEEAYECAVLAQSARLHMESSPNAAADEPRRYAPLVGYVTFLAAGRLAFARLRCAACTLADAQADVAFVCEAMEVMAGAARRLRERLDR